MKLVTRILLIVLGALGLATSFFCGKYVFQSVTTSGGFFEVIKQLFSLSNLFITILCIVCAITGIKDLLRGLIRGRSLFAFITGIIFAGATVYAIIYANQQALIQNKEILTIIISIGSIAALSILVGVFTLIIKARD